MGRRAHTVVISSTDQSQAKTVSVEILPVTSRLLPKYEKINKKGYVSLEEFDKMCLMVAGDERRAILKLLVSCYQRSLAKKDADETVRIRMLLTLYETEKLDKHLELVE